jgi:Fe-S-cluster containining protein
MSYMANLKATYKRIPRFNCLSGCTDCCGRYIVCSEQEVDAIQRYVRTRDIRTNEKGPPWCPFVHDDGCAIHPVRPAVCRLMGVVKYHKLRCPHKNPPKNALTRNQSQTILKEVLGNVTSQNVVFTSDIPERL